jgi:ligand-binding sensor domain-containing protein/signal transduction histidine kinase
MLPQFVFDLAGSFRAIPLFQVSLRQSVLFCLLAATAMAQHRPYRFDHWTTDDGLPQNSVNDICQTRDGYLWFTTLDGLVRYDGVRFRVFNKSNTPGLASNRLLRLAEDADGALWIGSEDAGVTQYAQGVFKTFTTQDGLPHNRVSRIQPDGQGGLHFQTRDGYAYWRGNRLVTDPENLNPARTRKYFAPSGAVWTLDETGLYGFKDGATTSYPPLIPPAMIRFAPFYEDRGGNLWFGANGMGVFKIKDGVITRYGEKDGLPPEPLEEFLEDHYGAIWISTLDGGLVRLQEGRISVYTVKDGLSSNEISHLLEDREGNLWVGTSNRGLNRLSHRFLTTYSTENGLHDQQVYPILQDRAGAIWIGAQDGLTQFVGGRFVSYTRQKAGFPSRFAAQSLYEDRAGRLWVGSYDGVGRFKDGKYAADKVVPQVAVFAIHQDRNGCFWFGTDKGLYQCKDGSCIVYDANNGLPGPDVKTIYEDRRGDLWIGTYDGIARLSNGKFTSYTERDGLAGNRVRYIYEDAEGTFWIGTYDSGLSRLKNGRFTNYTVKNGLYNEGVFQILEDAHGMFWIGCNKGIYRVSKQQLNDYAEGKISSIICTAYGQPDGMENTECNGGRQPAGIRARDGQLWLPTLGGAVVIDPNAPLLNPLPPPVHIESVVLDRNEVDFQGEVHITPDQKYLEISYAGLSFIKSEQAHFRYRLSGQDGDWIDAGTRRIAYYSYLPPGQYIFTVTAANSDGVWNSVGASVRIRVIPPFWRTWWFVMLSMLIVMGAALLWHHRRVARLEQARAAQAAFSRQLMQSQEDERKRIAAELHDSLGQSLAIIKNRALLSLNAPDNHERALEQLREISEASAEVIDEVKEIAHNLRPYQLDRLGLTKTIEGMIRKVAETHDARFAVEVDRIDGLFTPEGEINLFRIVQESVNNIVEHAEATEASVTIKREDHGVTVTIRDNGRGFDSAPAAGGSVPRGFGLVGMAERARVLDGNYEIHSTPSHGTTVKLTIPLTEVAR